MAGRGVWAGRAFPGASRTLSLSHTGWRPGPPPAEGPPLTLPGCPLPRAGLDPAWQVSVVCLLTVGELDRGVIPDPGRMERGSLRFHHAPQEDTRFTIDESCVSGIFHLVF